MELCSTVTDLAEFLRAEAEAIAPPPVSLIVFGSTARGCARADSDVDVLAVRPAGVEFDDDAWTDTLDEWRCAAQTITGRPVEIIEAGQDEVPTLLDRPGPTVWRVIAQEGVVVFGRPLHEVAEAILVR
jgi:predicted nucleotidyltransferase